MEYVITTDQPFDEIEARTIEALECLGLMVQRTFSLRSAIGADRGDMGTLTTQAHSAATRGEPGYSVLLLFAGGALRRPLGFITLYKQGDRTLINPVLGPEDKQRPSSAEAGKAGAGTGSDAEAELVATLVSGGLELCIDVAHDELPTNSLPVQGESP